MDVFLSITSQIPVSQIIAKDEDDVRRLFRHGGIAA
jgi:hypothetical protein